MRFGLTIVTLGVDDLDRAAAFYEQGLGLEPSAMSQGDIRFYQCGAAVLALYPRSALLEDAELPPARLGEPSRFDGVTLACNCASRAEVDGLMARAVAAGAHMVKRPREVFWGGYSGYFQDPEGHLWELAHADVFTLDERGGLVLPPPERS